MLKKESAETNLTNNTKNKTHNLPLPHGTRERKNRSMDVFNTNFSPALDLPPGRLSGVRALLTNDSRPPAPPFIQTNQVFVGII
jgi:hypothetical protein